MRMYLHEMSHMKDMTVDVLGWALVLPNVTYTTMQVCHSCLRERECIYIAARGWQSTQAQLTPDGLSLLEYAPDGSIDFRFGIYIGVSCNTYAETRCLQAFCLLLEALLSGCACWLAVKIYSKQDLSGGYRITLHGRYWYVI